MSKEAAALLDLIADKADALRRAGITRVEIVGLVRFTVGGVAGEGDDDDEIEETPEFEGDPLKDRATYGLPAKKPVKRAARSK